MAKIKDIFEGKELSVSEDDDFVTLYFGLTSIGVSKEDGIWDNLKEDLKKFVKELD